MPDVDPSHLHAIRVVEMRGLVEKRVLSTSARRFPVRAPRRLRRILAPGHAVTPARVDRRDSVDWKCPCRRRCVACIASGQHPLIDGFALLDALRGVKTIKQSGSTVATFTFSLDQAMAQKPASRRWLERRDSARELTRDLRRRRARFAYPAARRPPRKWRRWSRCLRSKAHCARARLRRNLHPRGGAALPVKGAVRAHAPARRGGRVDQL
jgi:hypothetical protein